MQGDCRDTPLRQEKSQETTGTNRFTKTKAKKLKGHAVSPREKSGNCRETPFLKHTSSPQSRKPAVSEHRARNKHQKQDERPHHKNTKNCLFKHTHFSDPFIAQTAQSIGLLKIFHPNILIVAAKITTQTHTFPTFLLFFAVPILSKNHPLDCVSQARRRHPV